jgi:hypothetical protein
MRTGSIGDVEDADNKDNETFAPASMLESTRPMQCVVMRACGAVNSVRSVVQHTGSILFLRQLVA